MPHTLHELFSEPRFSAHPHACIIYDNIDQYRKVASVFVADGLAKNEKCVMAVDAYHPDTIREDLEKAAVDSDLCLRNGSLTLIDVPASYSGNGGFDPDATIRIWQDESNKALTEGYTALRVVGEATFSLGNHDLAEKLIYYENIINEVLFKKFPFKSLCVYDRKRYSLKTIKTAISAHPVLFYNDQMFEENIYYIPPEIHFKTEADRDEIDIMLDNIGRNSNNIIALKESEKKFRMMFENAPLSYQSLDENGNFLDVNQDWLTVLGYTRDEVIGRNFSEFLHPDWKDHFKENFPRFKAVGEVLGVEFEMMKKDGSFILVSFHGKIGRHPDQSFSMTHCIFQDITDLRRSETQQKEYTENLETIFNSVPNILMMVDRDGRIEKINQSGAALDGRSNDQLRGILCGTFFNCVNAVDDRICGHGPNCMDCIVRKVIDSTFETGNAQSDSEGQITTVSDGREMNRFFLISTAIMQIDSKERVLLSLTDVTHLKQLERRMQQSQKMEAIGNLAGGIAHDFNNILFPIIGISELMMEDLPENSLEHEHAREIHKAGERARDLVSQILAFSRQSDQEKMPVRFQKILKEVLKLCRSTIPRNIEIEHKIQQDCGSVWANATQLHQIGMNLITNAYHAVQEKNGRITVSLKEVRLDSDELQRITVDSEACIVFSVMDNGMGIPPGIRSKIFDPYFTTKEKGKGTGLGLAVIYGIVKELGGDVKVESEVGKGSVFTVYLPVMKRPADSDLPMERIDLKRGSEHIFLVDDEPPVLQLEKRILERLGYTVTPQLGSVEALNTFKAHPYEYDLVLSDMSMPNMTGDQLAMEIKKIRSDIPFIVCTGFSERINKENARVIGVDGFLMKPIVKSDMAEMIRTVLDRTKRDN